MMLDKKHIWVIFYLSQMGHKAVGTTHCGDISNAFGLGAANEGTVQWWFKKFC